MLTVEQNEELTRVGPGTRMGELLRRYWYPIAFEQDFDARPSKTVRLLGENWTLYKTPSGRYGIIGEACPHRRASLTYGIVHEDGIRCGYHGWKYDFDGQCVEQPAESDNTTFRDKIRAKAGSAQTLGRHGLGLRRARPGARAAPVRRLRRGRHPRHRRGDAALQLVADHGELRRPAPRRVAARRLLRVPRPDPGLRGAQVVPEEAHQGRVRRVRVRHHQAPRARGPHRGQRRLGHRSPDDVPATACGSAACGSTRCRSGSRSTTPRRGSSSTPSTTPRAAPGRSRNGRSSTTTRSSTRTATSSPTTSRART